MREPNKFLDSMKLQDWMLEYHPEVFEEWELSDECNETNMDFWDWLDIRHPGLLAIFKDGLK